MQGTKQKKDKDSNVIGQIAEIASQVSDEKRRDAMQELITPERENSREIE